MDHGPAIQSGPDNASEYKSKVGVKMFIVYGIVYLGFILINTFKSKWMAKEVLFGVNLAVIYGFGLILLAIVLGIIYNQMCTKMENKLNKDIPEGGAE